MSTEEKPIKVVLAKIGLDGHDRGINMITMWLRDAGMEVVYLGRFLTEEEVAVAAVQEAAEIIGLSFLGGEHLFEVAKVVKTMKEKNLHIPLVIGGIIPERDFPKLKEMGVSAIFSPGTPMEQIVREVKRLCNR